MVKAWKPIGEPNIEMGVNGIDVKLSFEFSDMYSAVIESENIEEVAEVEESTEQLESSGSVKLNDGVEE